jgi:hypothetical protein
VILASAAPTFGLAWLAATVALALHVADEATHDFLAWYNPSALRIRRALGGLPFPPTFTFVPWLLGLIAAVMALGALTPFAYRGMLWLRPLAYVLAAIHVGNGLLHLVGSILAGRRVPGVLSAPILVLTGGWLAYVAATLV